MQPPTPYNDYELVSADKVNNSGGLKRHNLTYLPSGKAVRVTSIKEQKEALKKLFVIDWKRQPYIYPTAFEGEVYHLVNNKKRA